MKPARPDIAIVRNPARSTKKMIRFFKVMDLHKGANIVN